MFFVEVFSSLGGPGVRLGGYVGRCWLQLGRLWLILRRCWEMLGEMRAKIAPRGAKMNPKGAKIRQLDAMLEESCGQEAPRSIQEAHFGVMLKASWSIWSAFWRHLEQKTGKQKPFKNRKFFLMVFDSLGGPGERLGGYVGRCWLQVGRLWLILGRCWGMLAPRCRTRAARLR